MEQTPLPPLLSDEILAHLNCRCENCVRKVAKVIEADRAKTREVVQALVDALERTLDPTSFAMTQARLPITQHEYRRALQQGSQALALAKSQLNIEPTKP